MHVFDLAKEQQWNPQRHVEKILGTVGEGDVTVACWEPGQISPYHSHPHATEIYFCYSGGGKMRTPTRTIDVVPGSFVVHPDIKRIVICEIEPLIPQVVSQFFAKENYDVVRDPREHPDAIIGSLDKQARQIHEGPGRVRLRQYLEATLFHEDRRRLLPARRAVGHHAPAVARLPGGKWHRLVDEVLSGR